MDELAPGLRRIRAPNPSPMTSTGTNSYLLGRGEVCVVDPGPDLDDHLEALLRAIGPARVSHIVVTHGHLDHSALAPRLARKTGAPVLAFGGAGAGRSAAMEALVGAGLAGGGEGIDRAFAPDRRLADGERIEGDGWTLEALHTPGHLGNHLCLDWGGTVFSGDHVMGWASTLISPPDGDLTDFMASCDRLLDRSPRRLLPGHGDPVEDPAKRIACLVAHRRAREAQILAALAPGPATAQDLARRIYTDAPRPLLPAATRNVLAHLIDLRQKSRVRIHGPLSTEARFALT